MISTAEVRGQAGYCIHSMNVYREENDKYLRGAKCPKIQTGHTLTDMDGDDLIVGRVKHGIVEFSPQYGGLYTYYFSEKIAQDILGAHPEDRGKNQEFLEAVFYWKEENTLEKLNDRFTEKRADLEKYKKIDGNMGRDIRLGTGSTPTERLALIIPDLDKLTQLDIPSPRVEVEVNRKDDSRLSDTFLLTIDAVVDAIEFYEREMETLIENAGEQKYLVIPLKALRNMKTNKPETPIEGLQLYWICVVLSDLMDHGYVNVYLEDLYADGIDTGVMNEEIAIRHLTRLYKHYDSIGKVHDTRVVIGGKGHRNEGNVDGLAMVIMKTSGRVKGVVLQLMLRYYKGMKKELFEKALKVDAEGCSYPILYNDDTNIPAVVRVFDVPEEDAESYIPAGYGEYVPESRSIGMPNSGVNLLRGLELTFHHGRNCFYNVAAEPDIGDAEEFVSLDRSWQAFTTQIDNELIIMAWAQEECYNLMEESGAFLHLSILMKDCIEREKPVFEDDIRHLNGTTRIMGMILAAGSLTVIKKLVYGDKVMILEELVHILDYNSEGYEKERRMMQNYPKHGSDDVCADGMAPLVLNYVTRKSIEHMDIIGLNKYDMVSVNSSENAVWGIYVMASIRGRKNEEAMANASGAPIGGDKNGITPLLNSMSKSGHSIHAGVINNVRFSKELFRTSYKKVKLVIYTFLEYSRSQINLVMIGRDDLIDTKKHPEEYQNLIIRIGGFNARFVELNFVVQDGLTARTTCEVSQENDGNCI